MDTKSFFGIICAVWISAAVAACSPVAGNIREQADPNLSFDALQQDTASYINSPVVLGGFILKTENQEGRARLFVLQAPLGFQDRPGGKDASQGRFIAEYAGFLDPEVYRKDRMVTVAGTVSGRENTRTDDYPYPLVTVAASQIHLWAEETAYPHPYYYDPFPPFWPYHRYGPHVWPYWY